MKITRVYADEQGETHLGVLELPRHDAALGMPTSRARHISASSSCHGMTPRSDHHRIPSGA